MDAARIPGDMTLREAVLGDAAAVTAAQLRWLPRVDRWGRADEPASIPPGALPGYDET